MAWGLGGLGAVGKQGAGVARPGGIFVSRVRPDGVIVRLESRFHRKHQKPATGSTWWAPGARGWWIAVLFAIGSLLFALGSVPGYASSAAVGYISPVTGQVHNAGRANIQTLIGAICFLIGAVLLLPERTEETGSLATAPAGDGESGA